MEIRLSKTWESKQKPSNKCFQVCIESFMKLFIWMTVHRGRRCWQSTSSIWIVVIQHDGFLVFSWKESLFWRKATPFTHRFLWINYGWRWNGLKLDLRELCQCKIWLSNFEMMKDIGKICIIMKMNHHFKQMSIWCQHGHRTTRFRWCESTSNLCMQLCTFSLHKW